VDAYFSGEEDVSVSSDEEAQAAPLGAIAAPLGAMALDLI